MGGQGEAARQSQGGAAAGHLHLHLGPRWPGRLMRSWGCSPGDGCSSWSRTCSPSPQGGGPRGASQPGPGPHRPSALQPAQEAAPQRCHITVTLRDSSWCCRHHVQVGSRVGWGGRRAGRQLGGVMRPLDPAPLPGDFLPRHQPQPGRVLCLLPLAGRLLSSHGDVLERLAGSWRACEPPASPPRSASQIQPFFSSCLNDCLRHSVSVACPEVSHTPGGTRGCQGPRGSRVGEGQQPRLHHDLVGGEGAVVQACVVQP